MYTSLFESRFETVKFVIHGWKFQDIRAAEEDAHVSMAGYFAFSSGLEPGKNAFILQSRNADGSVLEEKKLTIFYQNDFTDPAPRSDAPRSFFHGDTFNEHCSGCHDLDIPPALVGSGGSVEEYCSPCHRALVQQTTPHYPASEWSCLTCHDASSTQQFSLYTEKDYNKGVCFECHTDIEEALSSSAVVHFPAEDRCMTCHDPHGSPARALLVDQVNRICSSCHEEDAQRPHPVVNHPVSTIRKPSVEDKVIDCASCHLPHASSLPKLLPSSRGELCKKCHAY